MKSPEQMGGMPEQPNNEEEIMEKKEETFEKPALSEPYNKAEWEKLKQSGPAFAGTINKGKEIGVPQEELDQLAQDIIARETANQDYLFVYNFRKGMKIGTEEEIRAVGEQAYKFLLENGKTEPAMRIADGVYGKDSEEWKRANKANELKRKKTEEKRNKEEEMEDNEQEQDLTVTISKDATFADLFSAIDAIEEDNDIYFEEELWDNFDTAIVNEVLAFRDMQADKATTTKVLDFFKERGYSQSDITAFLPIKFKRERKKK